MAGLTLSEIRAAVGAQLRSNIDRSVNVDVDGEGKPPPVIRLRLRSDEFINYWETFGSTGIASVNFEVEIDPANNDQSAVRRLDEFLSVGTGNGSSVVDALMADKTLGGVAQTLQIGASAYDDEEVTAVFGLTVVMKKSGAQA